MKNRTIALPGAILITGLLLAGCSQTGADPMSGMHHNSSTTPTPPMSTGTHNSADVAFAQMMIPHHRQAVEMADSLLAKTGIDPEVRGLAQTIKDAQSPEIITMSAWLTRWGVDIPGASSGMGGMDHGDGMMSQDDMDQLDRASGSTATKLFLEQMTTHHSGAISMAKTEVKKGSNPDAVALARNIITAQTDEVAQMKSLLSRL